MSSLGISAGRGRNLLGKEQKSSNFTYIYKIKLKKINIILSKRFRMLTTLHVPIAMNP